jgi:HAD superfamily hydrolase (TIGR01490 family)
MAQTLGKKRKSVHNSKKRLAVFDIDGTIFRSSLLIELVEALIENKIFPKVAKSYYETSLEKWHKRTDGYDPFIMDVVKTYLRFIKGVRRAEVYQIAEQIVEQQKLYTYRYTRDLIQKLKKDHFMLAVSLSPYEIVTPFAKAYGFNKTYAHVYEVDKNVRFTGNVLYGDIMTHKDQSVARTIQKENLNLKGSIGVGDSESDAAFLKLVDSPIAFNPSKGLYKIAKRRGWKIVVERKDVVYEVN